MQLVKRLSPRRLIAVMQRRGLWGLLTLVLALLACYGTLVVLALLSMIGITLVVREDVWAGTIMLFVLLSASVVVLGIKRHHVVALLVPVVIGVTLIAYVMFSTYNLVLEISGFVLLGIAIIWDYRLRREMTLYQKQNDSS
jgi:arsenite methyltransferase